MAARKSTFDMPFRRRREGKTDYKKRLALVKSKKLRLVVRKSNMRVIVHAVRYEPKGDVTVATADSRELVKYKFYGTNNTPSAYLVGFLLGKRLGKEKCVLDMGRKSPSHGNVIFAALKGAIDAGVEVPHSAEALPSEDRISGKVLDDYAKKLGDKAKTVFSNYIKAGIQPGEIQKAFEKAKAEIAKVKE
ncbi:50S ribosomal protein L18 [uncultured archaeon]|nr:50S ribosomal protein L18 [uncultured archaeon]